MDTGTLQTWSKSLSDWRCRRHQAISRLVPTRTDEDRAVSATEVRLTRAAFLLSAVVVLLSTPSHAVRAAHVVAQLFRLSVPPHPPVCTVLRRSRNSSAPAFISSRVLLKS